MNVLCFERLDWDGWNYQWLRRLCSRGATHLTSEQQSDLIALCGELGERGQAILDGFVTVRRYSLAELAAIGADWIDKQDGGYPNDDAKRVLDGALQNAFSSQLGFRDPCNQAREKIDQSKQDSVRLQMLRKGATSTDTTQNLEQRERIDSPQIADLPEPPAVCETCSGNGITCEDCNNCSGSGLIKCPQCGAFEVHHDCKICSGEGQYSCEACNGTGEER
jgi:hypothetical protein